MRWPGAQTNTQVCWWQRGRLRTKASSVFAVLQGARSRKCSLANCAGKCCVLKRHWNGTSLTSTPNDRRSIAAWSANVCTALETRSWPTSTPTTSRGLVTSILNSFRICLLYVPRPQVLLLSSLLCCSASALPLHSLQKKSISFIYIYIKIKPSRVITHSSHSIIWGSAARLYFKTTSSLLWKKSIWYNHLKCFRGFSNSRVAFPYSLDGRSLLIPQFALLFVALACPVSRTCSDVIELIFVLILYLMMIMIMRWLVS